MRSSRVFQGALVGVSALALALAGCERDDDAEADDDTDEEEEAEAEDEGDEADEAEEEEDEQAAAPGEAEERARAATDDSLALGQRAEPVDLDSISGGLPSGASYSMLPAGSEFVVGVTLPAVLQSELWGEYAHSAVAALDQGGDLAEAQGACGFDPLAQIENIFIAGDTEGDEEFFVAVEGLARDDVTSCLEGLAELHGRDASIEEDGDFVAVQDEDGGLSLAWIDDSTFVTGGPDFDVSPEDHRAWLEARLAGDDGLGDDAPLVGIIENEVEKDSGLWFGVVPAEGSAMGQEMALPGGSQAEAVYGSITPAEGLSIALGVRFDSAGQAQETLGQIRQMLEMFRHQAGELQALIDNAEMRVEDADMRIDLALSEEEISQVVDGVGNMFGGMMMGPGADLP